MTTKGQHVVPSGGKWRVVAAGASRASGVFTTEKEAVSVARDTAKRNGSELYIHGPDGRIRQRDSYGRDAHLPKG